MCDFGDSVVAVQSELAKCQELHHFAAVDEDELFRLSKHAARSVAEIETSVFLGFKHFVEKTNHALREYKPFRQIPFGVSPEFIYKP